MQVTVDIPDLVAGGRATAELAHDLRVLAVLDAFRAGRISSGRAARLLDMKRVAFLEFAGSRGVPTMNYSAEDLALELEDIAAGAR